MDIATQYADALQRKFQAETDAEMAAKEAAGKHAYDSGQLFHIESGQKFDRIVQSYKDGHGGSVHAFVERSTGHLIKAAGYKAPAKSKTNPTGLQTKFNLSTPSGFKEALDAADRFGGYLYA